MATDRSTQSRLTFQGGRKGFVLGALAGAVVFGLFGVLFDLLDFGTGGAGLSMMAGMAVGALAGMMIGALRARRRPAHPYRGPERRFNTGPYAGRERRAVH